MKKLKILVEKIKNNKFYSSLFKNSFWAFAGDTFASVINLMIVVLIIKLIGNDEYGVFVLAESYMLIIDNFINIQCWKSVIQYGKASIVNNKIDNLLSYIKYGCILDISTAILGGIIGILLASIIGSIFNWSGELILCAKIFSLVIFSNFAGTPTALLRIMDKFNLVALQKSIRALLKFSALVLIFFIEKKVSLLTCTIIYCCADMLGNFLLIIFAANVLNKKYGLKNMLKARLPKDIKEFTIFTMWGTASEVVDIPVHYFDVFIVSTLGTKMVAIYKVFRQVGLILNKLTAPIHQAIMPQFSEKVASGESKQAYRIVLKIRNVILIIMGPISIILGITSPLWLKFIFGQIYADYWYVLLFYLIVQTFALSYTAIHPYFVSLGKVKESAIYVFIANLIYVCIALVLVSKLQMIGIVIAYLIQVVVVILLKKIKIEKTLENEKNFSSVKVIIIGGNHHNTLGVVRSLGHNHIFSSVIITSKSKRSYINKSKYVDECLIVEETEKNILECLNKLHDNTKKCILIPTSDYAALIIDKNLNKLMKKFILPSIDKKEGKLVEMLNKHFQSEEVNKYGILRAKTFKINLKHKNVEKDIEKMSYPCVLKPNVSAHGNKSDIRICEDKDSLKLALKEYKELQYQECLLQEYIDYEKEYGLIGCIHNGVVIVPGIIEKTRIFPIKKGNISFGKIKKIPKSREIQNILNYMKKINYSGMFDIELFKVGNHYYLNEINFRNSGNTYAYLYENVYIVYLWVLMVLNIDSYDEKKEIEKEYFIRDEKLELKQLFHRNINAATWLKAMKQSKSGFIYDKHDKKPYIYKILYAILRRL